MTNVKIIDDFLPPEQFDFIQNEMMSFEFAWHRREGINDYKDGNRQFIHLFYSFPRIHSDYYGILEPILFKLKAAALIRIKANLVPKTHEIIKHGFHRDQHIKCKVAVYYINTNNGYTEFKDGTKVQSVANRMVIFDDCMEHTGTSCTDEHDRIVINFNYFEGEEYDV